MAAQSPRRASEHRSSARKPKSAGTGGNAKRLGAGAAARRAREHIGELVGRPVDGVSGLLRTEDGWQVRIDVVEVPRVPDTTSLMATYRLRLDDHGELVGYDRVARFRRSDTTG